REGLLAVGEREGELAGERMEGRAEAVALLQAEADCVGGVGVCCDARVDRLRSLGRRPPGRVRFCPCRAVVGLGGRGEGERPGEGRSSPGPVFENGAWTPDSAVAPTATTWG